MSLFKVADYLTHRWRSTRLHGIHSPFVFELQQKVLRDQPDAAFDPIAQRIRALRSDPRVVEVTDFGAGSRRTKSNHRKVREIAKWGISCPKQARRLLRLAQHFQPTTILELGTSLGIGTASLATGAPQSRVISLEGSEALADIAEEGLDQLGINNVEVVRGRFQDTLPRVLNGVKVLDLVYIDGHHQKQPTLDYFEACLKKAHEETVFVFDDIRWSREMKEAWMAIRMHPKVTVTVDLFDQGMVCLKTTQEEQHFMVRD